MMTKTAFFALLNDANNRIGSTAHVAVTEEKNGNLSLIIKQESAPNSFLSTHKAASTANAAAAKYIAWMNEWATARANAAAQEEDRVRTLEADRAAGRPVDEEGNDTREWCGNDIEAAHAEALTMNAEHDKGRALACRDAVFFGSLDSFGRRVVVEAAHGEALETEAQIRAAAVAEAAAHQLQLTFRLTDATTQRGVVAQAHAEALEMNVRHNAMTSREHYWFEVYSYGVRADRLAAAHAEALEMNAQPLTVDRADNRT